MTAVTNLPGTIFNKAKDGWTSDNLAERGAWTGGTVAVTVGGIGLGKMALNKIGNRPIGSGLTMMRVAGMAGLGATGLGVLSAVRLSSDNYVGMLQGSGLGLAIGGGGVGAMAGMWLLGSSKPQVGNRISGAAMIGAAAGTLIYGALGASGVIDDK